MKTFRYLQRFCMTLFVGGSMCILQACDDEEDDNGIGGSDNTTVGEVVSGSGKKLLSAGDFNFYYSPDGKIKYAIDDYAYHEFSSNQVISHYDYKFDEGDDIGTTNLSYNGKGYISKFQMSETWEDEGESYKFSSTANISYDGEGHIVKATGNTSSESRYDGEIYKRKATSTINFIWENGLLKRIEEKDSEDDDDWWTSTVTFDYGDRMYANNHRQYGSFVEQYFSDAPLAWAYLGMFGTGPDYLPVRAKVVTVEGYEGETYEGEENCIYSYEFNDDGTIRCVDCSSSDDYYTGIDYFTYGTIDEQGEPDIETYQAKVTRTGTIQKGFSLFGSHLRGYKK